MSQKTAAATRPRRKHTTLSRQLDDIADGTARLPSRRSRAGSRLKTILNAVKDSKLSADTPEPRQSTRKSASLPSTPQKQSIVSASKKRKRNAKSKSHEEIETLESNSTIDLPKNKEDAAIAETAISTEKKRSDKVEKEVKPIKRRKTKADSDRNYEEDESDSDSAESDDAEKEEKLFVDNDVYDSDDEGSLIEPKSADAKLPSKPSSQSALPNPSAAALPVPTLSSQPIPSIIKSSPPPSPTKQTKSPTKVAYHHQHHVFAEPSVVIHDRPATNKLTMSSLLHDVQERATAVGSPIKAHAASSLAPPPASPARRSLSLALEDSQSNADGMVTLEIESSQDGNSRSSSPAPSQFLRTSNQLMSENAMDPN